MNWLLLQLNLLFDLMYWLAPVLKMGYILLIVLVIGLVIRRLLRKDASKP